MLQIELTRFKGVGFEFEDGKFSVAMTTPNCARSISMVE